MPERYDPERSLVELREARDVGGEPYAEMAEIMSRAAIRAAVELWPDPRAREQAGLGAVVAAASLVPVTEHGSSEGPILNMVGFFGLALVESARAEVSGA